MYMQADPEGDYGVVINIFDPPEAFYAPGVDKNFPSSNDESEFEWDTPWE